MSSIDKLLHNGAYSDLTITADGLSLKFHKAVIAGLSSALTEATETDKLELKCSTVTLTIMHNLFYNQPLDEKHTTLPELWGLYEFLHKYLCTDLAKQIHKKINKSLVYADTMELVGFISALDKVNFGKEFLDEAIKLIARQLNTISVSPIYCIKKDYDDCCKQAPLNVAIFFSAVSTDTTYRRSPNRRVFKHIKNSWPRSII